VRWSDSGAIEPLAFNSEVTLDVTEVVSVNVVVMVDLPLLIHLAHDHEDIN
jgi:hypothetical protein